MKKGKHRREGTDDIQSGQGRGEKGGISYGNREGGGKKLGPGLRRKGMTETWGKKCNLLEQRLSWGALNVRGGAYFDRLFFRRRKGTRGEREKHNKKGRMKKR